MMSNPRRLHPVAAILILLRQLKEMALPLLIFIIFGTGQDSFIPGLPFIGAGILLVGMLVVGILSWLRFTYRLENNELRLEYGILIRKRRFIPRERIQSINLSEGILQRMFGLVKVQVETAGGGHEAEAVLSAVTKEDARLLKEELFIERLSSQDDQEEIVKERKENLMTVSQKDLLIFAITSGGVGVILSGIAAFIFQFERLFTEEILDRVFQEVLSFNLLIVVIAVFLILAITWLISIVATYLKYGNFKLSRYEDDLQISYGLLEKQELTIPLKKIQAIRIAEGILRQPFQLTSLYIESAGGVEKGEKLSTVLFPILMKKKLADFLEKFIPEYQIGTSISSLPKRALYRYLIRALIPAVIVTLPLYFIFKSWLVLIILPLAMLIGFLYYHSAGGRIEGSFLILRFRVLSLFTVLVPRKKIQSLTIAQSYFQKKQRLATLHVSILSNTSTRYFSIRDIDEQFANQIFNWYSADKVQE